jgi:hypothetical protein
VEHADRWALGLGDQDVILFQAVATCPDAIASESTARAAEAMLDAARKDCDNFGPGKPPHREEEGKARQMAKEFFRKAYVAREGRSVLMRSTGPGTIADFAALVAAGVIN